MLSRLSSLIRSLLNPGETQQRLREEFGVYEKGNRINSLKLGAILVMIFMPVGSLLEVFVYPKLFWEFFLIRLISSIEILIIWWLLNQEFASKYYRPLGWGIAIIPTIAISGMIAVTEGFNSPYYAGLNLVFLGSVIVLRWTFLDSLLVFVAVMLCYLIGCAFHGFHSATSSIIFNNLYFLGVTGIFILLGSYAYDKIRFNEFRLNSELTQQREKLLELDQSKNEFFANLSHELRTPLTLILGQVEALKRAPSDLQTTLLESGYDVRTALEGIDNSGLRLYKLINELLDLMKLDQKTLQVSWDSIRIQPFLKGILSAVRGAADLEKVKIQFECQPDLGEFWMDKDKLETILINLITNAIKFSGPGKTVFLRARLENSNRDSTNGSELKNEELRKLVIEVEDNGPGIEEANLARIFDRFWQADGSMKKLRQGTGIGLAIVKEFVDVMGGTIKVKSAPNHGVYFELKFEDLSDKAIGTQSNSNSGLAPEEDFRTSLPSTSKDALNSESGSPDRRIFSAEEFSPDELELDRNEKDFLGQLRERARKYTSTPGLQSRVTAVEPLNQRRKPVVLIADDEPEMRKLISSQLESKYHVLQAVDGEQALQLTRQFHPDLVILDWMMPELDGLQTLTAIRDSVATRSIPALMLTAWANNDSKNQALQIGANEFLTKPFSSVELLQRVHNLIKLYQWQVQVEKQNQQLRSALDELEEAQQQLYRSQKLASLGKLSATMIHEINNPLNYMKTALHGLKNDILEISDDKFIREGLKDLSDGIHRINRIVSGLKTFAYHSNLKLKPLLVQDIVQESLKWMGVDFDSGIEISISIDPEAVILGDKELLIQVLTNLFRNSKEAMSSKEYTDLQGPKLEIRANPTPSRTFLSIRDNGPGIDELNIARVFDPFFTLKDVGKGLGLGLSVVHNIIEAHGGNIHVESTPNEYCEFQIYIPTPEVDSMIQMTS